MPLGVAGVPILDGEPDAVPAGQHQPALAPAEHPRDGAQILDARRRCARRGPAADVEVGDLGDRRRRRGSTRRSRRSRTRGRGRRRRERRQRRPSRAYATRRRRSCSRRRGSRRAWRRRALRGCAGRGRGSAILAGDDLALLGDARSAVDAARRLGEDRVVARPAAAADGAAATVEQAQPHAVRRAPRPARARRGRSPSSRRRSRRPCCCRSSRASPPAVAAAGDPGAVRGLARGASRDRAAARRGRRSSRTGGRCGRPGGRGREADLLAAAPRPRGRH